MKAGWYNVLIALLTAVTIVLGMRLMGALLISSLVIFPALTSMRIFKSFRSRGYLFGNFICFVFFDRYFRLLCLVYPGGCQCCLREYRCFLSLLAASLLLGCRKANKK